MSFLSLCETTYQYFELQARFISSFLNDFVFFLFQSLLTMYSAIANVLI
jgi:hypothetical protein